MSVNPEKIAKLVKEQLPEFVKADYQTFVSFIQAYYEFLEQDRGARDAIRNARQYQDIDTTIDAFVEQFKSEFAKDIPEVILADKANLYKNIKDFYQSKGSEKSFELLFRILFNENISFFYPSTTLLRPSDGKWTNDRTIRVRKLVGDSFRFISTKITGATSGATAVVENVLFYQDGPNEVYELFLNIDSIKGEFIAGETIDAMYGTVELSAEIYYAFNGITLTNRGTGYSEGDIIPVSGGSGVNAAAKVAVVGTLGEIKKIDILNFGSGYNTPPTVDFSGIGNGDAIGVVSSGALCAYPGYYVGVDGQLSENVKLQDSKYYQAFSYVIRVGQSINIWRDVVKKVLHPAGLALFGEVTISTSASARLYGGVSTTDTMTNISRLIRLLANASYRDVSFAPTIQIVTRPYEDGTYPGSPVLAAHTQVDFVPVIILPHETVVNLMQMQMVGRPQDLILYVELDPQNMQISLPNFGTEVSRQILSVPGYGFGTNYGTIERFKFKFPPYTAKNQAFWGPTGNWTQDYIGTVNEGYWDTLGNTQVKDVFELNVGSMWLNPKRKQNICPEPYVTIEVTP